MTSIQSLASGRRDLLMIDPRIIHVKPGWNERHDCPEYTAHIRMLADSIKAIGVQMPLTIYLENEIIFLSDGESRLKGTMLAISEGAEIKAVPCMVAPKGQTDAERVADMFIRNGGRPHTPLEIANLTVRLTGMGWTLDQISRHSGLTVGWLNELLALRASPQAVTDAVKAGHVSATLAAELVTTKGGQEAAQAIAEAKDRTGKKRITKKDLPPQAPGLVRDRAGRTALAAPIAGITPAGLLRAICEAETQGEPEALANAIREAREYLERMGQ
jgi:hypothetical protein